jgi:hypothetical protein
MLHMTIINEREGSKVSGSWRQASCRQTGRAAHEPHSSLSQPLRDLLIVLVIVLGRTPVFAKKS